MLYKRPTIIASPELPENIEKFNKARDLYSKMAIYFDENFYSENVNYSNCHMYMYFIYHMLACKKKYFTSFEDYDNYATYATDVVFMRFLRHKKRGERYKSVLNYAKATLPHLKTTWQNNTFRDVTNVKDDKSRKKSEAISAFIHESIQSSPTNNSAYELDISTEYNNIPNIIKDVINDTPYKNDKRMCKNLYMSCLLTLLKSFTLSNVHKERLDKKREALGTDVDEKLIIKTYAQEVEESLTVWNLDASMADYVKILVNKVKDRLYKEVREIKSYYSIPDYETEMIINSAWETTNHINYEEENNL